MTPPSPTDAVSLIQREVDRARLRARNGIRYVTAGGVARVGATPKDLVWQRDRATLWRYRSDEVRYRTPVLLMLGLVSRSYILDLHPGNSLVEHLRNGGFDVFLLDFGVPDEVDAANRLVTYADVYLRGALEAARRETGADTVSGLGYCMGANFMLMQLGARTGHRLSSLVVLAPPIDFRHCAPLIRPLAEGKIDPEELIDEETGLVPAGLIRNAFRSTKPTHEIVQYANLWENLWRDEYLEGHQAMTRWVGDHVPFPGAAFRQYARSIMRDNGFVTGHLRLATRPVNLQTVRIPVFNAMAEFDEIVPLRSAEALAGILPNAPYEELRVSAGHIGLVAGRRCAKVTAPGIISFLSRHSEAA